MASPRTRNTAGWHDRREYRTGGDQQDMTHWDGRYVIDHDIRNGEYQVYDTQGQTIVESWPDYEDQSLQRAVEMCRGLNAGTWE